MADSDGGDASCLILIDVGPATQGGPPVQVPTSMAEKRTRNEGGYHKKKKRITNRCIAVYRLAFRERSFRSLSAHSERMWSYDVESS